MKKSSELLLILLINCNFLFSQNKEMKMEIKYFDFNMTTDTKIECSEFEKAGDFKIIQIEDTTLVSNFCLMTKSLKKDTLNNYMPDTRAKIILVYASGKKDIICLSNFAICCNCVPMKFNKKYVFFIKDIIKQNDKNFTF